MSRPYDKLMKDAECNKYVLGEEIYQLGREDAIEEMIEVADCEHGECFACAFFSTEGCKLHSMLILRRDNEFFNFDKVIEIEKKKSYNQALEEVKAKIDEYIEKATKRYEIEIIEMYSDVVGDLQEWICEQLKEVKQ